MSWQALTIGLIVAIVIGGFAWYERSRPGARMVALVAALAGLAVAGRLLIHPFPNVVATTDIALLTGYALGGPAGFAVGALAAPISNIWLGQGPWTVWQMAGWGLAGLAGAALARLTGRRCGRLGLALVCAAVGLLYGALLDLSVMVTYGGEQSLDRYLVLAGRGIPFNVAHAVGNFTFALIAGPALVRVISRYRERLTFRWEPAAASLLLVLALAPIPGLGPAPADAAPAGRAGSWLAAQQSPGGGFGAYPGGVVSPAMTGWVALGLEASGRNPLDVSRGGTSAIAYLRANSDRIRSTGDLERTILALRGAGADPRRFAGRDLVRELARERSAAGSFHDQVNLTAFGILALRSAGVGGLKPSLAWLRRAQNGDGGWGFRADAPSDADSTGAVLQALAVGGSTGAISDGVGYLRRSQGSDGSWTLSGGAANAQSTAWAIQGLVAVGRARAAIADGVGYLDSLRAADGHYRYSTSSDQTSIWVTAQAIMARMRVELPLSPVPRAAPARGGGAPSDAGGNPDGGGDGSGSGAGDTAAAPGSQSGAASGNDPAGGGSQPGGSGAVDPDVQSAPASGTSVVPGTDEELSPATPETGATDTAERERLEADPGAGTTTAPESGDRTPYELIVTGVLLGGGAAAWAYFRRRETTRGE